MTHYNRSYAGMEGINKRQHALNDIKEWLGDHRKFLELTKTFRAEKPSQRAFTFYCGLAGVQGYPVVAWWRHCFPDTPWVDEEEERN